MQIIPTSPETVSKLKKAAKLLVRDDPSLAHHNALERVALGAGYLHWKHVTECADATAASSPLASLTGRACVLDQFPVSPQEFVVIAGPSGSGKTLRGYDYALNALREGRPVHILDVGRSYAQLAKLLGGAYLIASETGQLERHEHGSSPLTVIELENLARHKTNDALALADIFRPASPKALLVVDELWRVASLFPTKDGLNQMVEDHLNLGGSVLLLSQDPVQSTDIAGIESGRDVRRVLVTLGRI
ncbi:hypothetical protein KXR69_26235 [Ralstonia holmesii]|uniref:TraG/VirB4 family ATPase n=1 Tax=Ralstonia holmesii TaxID=3058602 RepID=UPI003F17DE69